MKTALQSLILITFFSSFSQCPTQNLVLDTQEKVDNFIIQYPNCKNLNVDLLIRGAGIINLNGLKNLETSSKSINIGGGLDGDTSLVNLKGLENLSTIREGLSINFNSKLLNLDGLSSLKKVGTESITNSGIRIHYNNSLINIDAIKNLEWFASLIITQNKSLNSLPNFIRMMDDQGANSFSSFSISGNENLTSLGGFNNIKSINGNLGISYNKLANILGFDNLETVNGNTNIHNEPVIQNLEGLNSLNSITGNLNINSNPNLKNFNGLNNLENIEGYFSIAENANLEDFTGLEKLTIVKGDLKIIENKILKSFYGLSSLNSTFIFQLLNNDNISNFSGLDNLRYVHILSIWGNDMLTNFEGLEKLEEVGYKMEIRRNSKLQNFNGLNKLAKITGDLEVRLNDNIRNFTGLENLTSIKRLRVSHNPNLINFLGLVSIGTADELSLGNNDKVQNLEGLTNLQHLKIFDIYNNNNFQSLNGLRSIKTIEKININTNNILSDINAIANIDREALKFLVLQNNYNLSNCDIMAVCSHLINGKESEIIGNLTGCATKEEIIEQCNTPDDYDGDGVIDELDSDIDNDTIANDLDECDYSELGSLVNQNGCPNFSLPPNNFRISVTNETCNNSDNGKIEISANIDNQYVVKLVGANLERTQEFNSSTIFDNLEAESYEVCITVPEFPEFEKCFTIILTEPDEFSVNSMVDYTETSINLNLHGGNSYKININGEVFETTESKVSFPLTKNLNTVLIETDLNCQGSYLEHINLDSDLKIIPNPVLNDVKVLIPDINQWERVSFQIFSSSGKLIQLENNMVFNKYLQLNLEKLNSGMYIIRVRADNKNFTGKIIKK